MAQHNILGKKGEQMAVDLLLSKGYKILERNYRYLASEIDIIARKDNICAAVEVKTRSTADFGNPQDFVKPQQIQRLVAGLDYYITEHDLDVEARFDIVGIVKNESGTRIEHIENAFLPF